MNIRKYKNHVSLLVAAGMIYYLVSYIGLDQLVEAFSMIDAKYLVLALLLYGLTLTLNAHRWSTIIGITGHMVGIRKALHFQLIDKAANSIFPTSAVGMAVRSMLLKRDFNIPKSKGLASIVLDYGFEVFGTFLLAIPAFLLLKDSLPSYVNLQLYVCLGLLGLASFCIVLVNHPRMSKKLESGGGDGTSVLEKISKRKYGAKFLEFVGTFTILNKDAQNTYNAIGTTFGIRMVEAIRMMVLFRAFGIMVPFYYFILFESLWLFLSPFMITPGGIGAVESGRIILYSMLPQITSSSVAPAVFIDRFITFWLMMLLGILATIIYTRRGTGQLGDIGTRNILGFPAPENEHV
ncbi:MAG TPA: lysylphosphatidylglycerol synthase transmembrane domain-containing protein [Candidatus Methanofastidiosa archaeon]|nr:lysylphosphatidylglycerol synthase transmembrane domain-containing protein [Candidatus Methanofastidiosa archaeon]